MAEVRFPSAKSHPRLAWLAQAETKARRVPATVASAGLDVITEVERMTNSANSVSIAPPTGIDAEYHGSQIILPKIDTDIIPIGTVLMNVLLPPIEDLATAERIFTAYQKQILAFAKRIQALPFACITGHKITDPKHNLDQRGFRLFFGPASDVVFERIQLMLGTLGALTGKTDHPESRRDLAIAFQNLKFAPYENGKIGHSMLEDMIGYKTDTTLVDLR